MVYDSDHKINKAGFRFLNCPIILEKLTSIASFLYRLQFPEEPITEGFTDRIMLLSDKSHFLPRRSRVGLHHQKTCKLIDPLILGKYGAKEIALKKDDIIFREGEVASHYFQVLKGSVKMITNSPDGKEFIQGIFKTQDSFGEPPLFCHFFYPSMAIALEPTLISKLAKDKFFKLLNENFEIHLHLDRVLCERLKYKSMVLSEISIYDPEHRIMSLLKYLKNDTGQRATHKSGTVRSNHTYIVPFTRQQIADMSGLRVETVIRTVKKMEEDGKLQLVSRKIAF